MSGFLGSTATYSIKFSGDDDYTPIANLKSIQPPQITRPLVESRYLGGARVRRKPGMIDLGVGSITVEYDSSEASHVKLRDAALASTALSHRIIFPNNERWTYPAYLDGFPVSEFDADTPVDVTVGFGLSGTDAITIDTAS